MIDNQYQTIAKVVKILFLFVFLTSCSAQSKVIKLTVENATGLERTEEIVEVPLEDIKSQLLLADTCFLIVKDESGAILPSQQTYDGKLIFQAGVKAQSKQTYSISVGKKQNFEAKVFGRHYPERAGDFAWENDRVGFRFYGKELKEIQAPTSGLDLWYKRTDKLILDKWYADNQSGKASYHEDHGEGCDPYAVGQTLGGGSAAILVNEILHLNENFEGFEVLDNGPLRVTFKLTYPSLIIDGVEIAETRTISLDAGSQLTKVIQEYKTDGELTIGLGFPKRAKGDSILLTKGNNYFVYQEPFDPKNEQIYLGIIIPQGIDDVSVTSHTKVGNSEKILNKLPNLVATTKYKKDGRLVYYTGFGWTKFGFKNLDSFQDYVKKYSLALQEPLKVKITNK